MSGATPRKTPCASCPYRKNVASGVWHESEYEKLKTYDGEIGDQIENGGLAPFGCHQADGQICSGWLGHRDPTDLLAVRMGVSSGRLDPSCAEYETTVPLFATGAEAAEHGMKRVQNPDAKAREVIEKITKKRHL